MLKNLLCSFIGMVLLVNFSIAQPPNYAFQSVSGTYTPITGGTAVILTYNGAANNDDGITTPANAVPIGFTFNYNGTNYTSIKPCANGWASFSTTALTNNTDTWSNNLNTGPAANQRPLIAPLWDDMDMGAGGVSYLLSGSAPNRIMTIEWTMCKWDYNAIAPAMSFQVKLYETSNIIEFRYKQETGSIAINSGGVSIGITGTATGSFWSLNNAGTAPNVSATTETSDILTKPATGQIYRWIPYCSASATNVAGEKISNFTYNTINNNSSSTAGYENFSNISTTVSLFPASTLPFSVSISSFIPTDQVVIFIDFNHNGDFSDPGETVFTSTVPISSGTVSGNIVIPIISSTVLAGRTRMRIRLHDSGNGPNATSCGTSTNGQVEDYSIDIQPCFAGVIITQPANTAICNGGSGTISVATTGSGLTYQWQISTNGGGLYTNLSNSSTYSGTTTSTLSITGATLSMNNYLYKVIINGICTTPNMVSSAALLSVNVQAAISSNPVNSTVCQGSNASFTVSASGTSPSYQWQVSTDGGFNFSNIAGANAATLNLTAVANDLSLNRYRAIVTVVSCGSIISSGAILKVNPLPTVSLSAALLSQLYPGLTTSLFTTSNPAGVIYSWKLNGSVIPGATSSALATNVNGLGKYKVTVTDINGCTNTTNEVELTGLSDTRAFIYPNPTSDGRFQVRLYSGILSDNRNVIIYNSLGEMITKRELKTTSTYQEMDFDLGNMAPGVYIIKVIDRHDVKTAIGKLVIK
jgi:GEVED domain/Secretion system C-terminal sorting domain